MHLFSRLHRYGPVNSHDVWKCAAILLMIVDHIGDYFFPEMDWMRVIGRLAFPIFFFLIGYSGSTKLPLSLWLGAAILLAADWVFERELIPINILWTVILTRTYFMFEARLGWDNSPLINRLLPIAVWIIPTALVMEFGLGGLLMALCGRMVREHHRAAEPYDRQDIVFAGVTVSYLVLFSAISLELSTPHVIALLLLAIGLANQLRSYELRPMAQQLPVPLHAPIMLLARYSLEVYVLHLLLFKLLVALPIASYSS